MVNRTLIAPGENSACSTGSPPCSAASAAEVATQFHVFKGHF